MLWSFGRVRATMLRQGMRTSSIFNSRHAATRCNMVAKCAQHVAPNNVAIVWPELANVGPTMLGFQGSKLTLENSQNARYFDNLRVSKISTSKRLRVRIMHISQTFENNLLVVSPVC